MAYTSKLKPRTSVKKGSRQGQWSHTAGTFAAYQVWCPTAGQYLDVQVYLPPGYDPAKRYPVVYWLPGSDSSALSVATTLQPRINAAIAGGMKPAIWVVPEAGLQSYYLDNVSGSHKMATKMADLYRIVPTRVLTFDDPAWRFMAGFSMGGFGALKEVGLRPDFFCGVLSIGAPKLTWTFPMPAGSAWTQAQKDDLSPEESDTPGYLWSLNQAALKARGNNFLRMVCGTNDNGRTGVEHFNTNRTAEGYVFTYQTTPSDHNLANYLDDDTGWDEFIGGKLPAAA
jgi:enterochelin esterase-like enzyme